MRLWLAIWTVAVIDAKSVSSERCVLRSRPSGAFRASDLEITTVNHDLDELADGEVLVAVDMLSIEAFYRTMLDEEAYHGVVDIGAVVPALGYGTIVASKSKKLKVGSRVTGMLGAQQYAQVPAKSLQATASLPGTRATDALGRMGISGLTAYVGLACVLGPPKRKEVVVVSAAAGGVGTLAAQMAKARGAFVIGVAGGPAKRTYLLEKLKLNGAVDYSTRACHEAHMLRRRNPPLHRKAPLLAQMPPPFAAMALPL